MKSKIKKQKAKIGSAFNNRKRVWQHTAESPAGEEPRIKDFQQKIRVPQCAATEQTL